MAPLGRKSSKAKAAGSTPNAASEGLAPNGRKFLTTDDLKKLTLSNSSGAFSDERAIAHLQKIAPSLEKHERAIIDRMLLD